MLSNYECIEKMRINHKDIRDRIELAWGDWELIVFKSTTDRIIIIQGIENRKQEGSWFIKYTWEGNPDTIIGEIDDLFEYMAENHVDIVEFYEEV